MNEVPSIVDELRNEEQYGSTISNKNNLGNDEKAQSELFDRKFILQQTLLEISKKKFDNLDTAFNYLTEIIGKTLKISRCSIWLFDESHSKIICKDLYDAQKNLHEKDHILEIKNYPNYFRELKEKRIIDASDARNDKRTSEFLDSYLKLFNIFSMMDVPVRHHGSIASIICNEHCGEIHRWDETEINFVTSIADYLALQIEAEEKRKIKDDLLELKQQLEFITNSAADGIRIIDKDFNVIKTNKTMGILAGVFPDKMLNHKCHEIFKSKNCGTENCSLVQVLKSGTGFSREIERETADGRKLQCIEVITPYKDRNGEIIGILEDFRDISEIKQAQKNLKEEKQKAKQYLDVAGVIIIALDSKGNINLINNKGCEILHTDHSSVIGKNFFNNFVPEEMISEVKGNFLDFIKDGEESSKYFETQILTSNGERRYISWNNNKITNESGEGTRIICSGVDISEQKRIEKAEKHAQKILLERTNKLRVLYDTPIQVENAESDSIYKIICNNFKKICAASYALFISYNHKDESICIKTVSSTDNVFDDIYSESGIDSRFCINNEILNDLLSNPIKRFDNYFDCLSGIIPPDLIEKQQFKKEPANLYRLAIDKGQNILGIFIAELPQNTNLEMEDIVETYVNLVGMIIERVQSKIALKLSEERYRKLSLDLEEKVKERTKKIGELLELKDKFISQLGHDLKNPLNPLINLIPILKEKNSDPKSDEIFNVIIRNIGYMKNLVQKTLELAELNSTTVEFSFVESDLSESIDKIIQYNQYLIDDSEVIVENKIAKGIKVKIDDLRFSELLNNLLNNAVKYSDEPKKITLNASDNNQFVILSVRDNGIGMSEEQIIHAFDEFYKADGSRHDFDSSGLGLNICKRIVEKHGGKIWAESEGPGKGTTFYFTLPRL